MARILFTPFDCDGHDDDQLELRTVRWAESDLSEEWAVFDGGSPPSFETCVVSCAHPEEGKVWRSMYIPSNKMGTDGVSITWWARNNTLAGQFNVKEGVTLKDWLSLVGSKAILKGYQVLEYVGPFRALSKGTMFAESIAGAAKHGSLPALATYVTCHFDEMAKTMLEMGAFYNFFAAMEAKGKLPSMISDLMMRTNGAGLPRSLSNALLGTSFDGFSMPAKEDLPAPAIVVTRPSCWGTFG